MPAAEDGFARNPNPENPNPENPNPENPNPENPNPEPTYTPVSIENFSVEPKAMGYGELVKGAKITWSVTGDVDYITLILPDKNKTEIDLTNTTSPYTDEKGYVVEKENMTWTLKVIGKNGKPKSKDAKLSWNYRVYCGLSNKANYIDGEFMVDLLKNTLTKSRESAFEFERADNQYVYFAAPKDLYGIEEPPILQIVNLLQGGFKGQVINVTQNGQSIDYYLYRSNLFEYDDEFTVSAK